MRKALVIAPTGWGSVGDDALLRGSCRTLHALSVEPIVLVGSDQKTWQNELKSANAKVISTHQLFSPSGLLTIKNVRDVFVIGADIIDGGYGAKAPIRRLTLARILKLIGKRVAVISFSFNKHPDPEVVKAFCKLGNRVRYACRDRRSRERFELATGLSAELVADVGFLTEATDSPSGAELINWANQQRQDGNVLIYVNLSIGPFRSDPHTNEQPPEKIVDRMAACVNQLRQMLNGRLSVCVLPHDFRNPAKPWSDESLASALFAALEPVFGKRVRTVSTPFNSSEVCSMVKAADLVITGRMHLAIIALTAGVLPVSFTYQDKFEGMYEHFFADPSPLILPANELIFDHRSIATKLHALLAARQKWLKKLRDNHQKVVNASLRNFSAIPNGRNEDGKFLWLP